MTGSWNTIRHVRAPSWQLPNRLNDSNLGCAAIEQQNCYFDFFNLLFACRVWLQCAGKGTVPYVGIRSVSAQTRQSELKSKLRKMEKKKFLVLPYPSSPILEGTELRNSGGDIFLKIGFDVDQSEKYVTLRFKKVRAYRKRAESHCESWHVKDVMDNVAEVIGSDWVAELRAATNTQNKSAFEMNHYMIYVDDFGSLEVVAQTVGIEQ